MTTTSRKYVLQRLNYTCLYKQLFNTQQCRTRKHVSDIYK